MSSLQQPPIAAAATEWRLPTSAEFAQFANTNLRPVLAQCEADRRKVVSNLTMLFVVVGILAIGAGMLVMSGQPGPGPLLVVGIIALVIIAAGYHFITRDYRQKFKLNLVSRVIGFFGRDFEYNPGDMIPEGRFTEARIFDQHIDRYNGEDYINGTAGKTRFECSEVHAEYKTTSTDSKGRSHTEWHTIFKGLFFIADFNKNFNGLTLVLPDVAQRSLGWIGQKLQEWNISRPGQLVKLEDADFEKLFVVYSTDQIEARYILSPALMRRLVDYRQQLGGDVHVSFQHGNVFVAVNPRRDLFEPTVFSPLTPASCYGIFKDVLFALDIIQELNLNTRIWSKQ